MLKISIEPARANSVVEKMADYDAASVIVMVVLLGIISFATRLLFQTANRAASKLPNDTDQVARSILELVSVFLLTVSVLVVPDHWFPLPLYVIVLCVVQFGETLTVLSVSTTAIAEFATSIFITINCIVVAVVTERAGPIIATVLMFVKFAIDAYKLCLIELSEQERGPEPAGKQSSRKRQKRVDQ